MDVYKICGWHYKKNGDSLPSSLGNVDGGQEQQINLEWPCVLGGIGSCPLKAGGC